MVFYDVFPASTTRLIWEKKLSNIHMVTWINMGEEKLQTFPKKKTLDQEIF